MGEDNSILTLEKSFSYLKQALRSQELLRHFGNLKWVSDEIPAKKSDLILEHV